MYVAAFTLVVASCVALTKDNLKARLAYSTISQLSYVILGAALATSAGILGSDAYCYACLRQNYVIFLRRSDHGRFP